MQTITVRALGLRGWKFILPALLLCAVAAQAQTVTPIGNFPWEPPDYPLIQGLDGNFYGTSRTGGLDKGLVFMVTPGGTITDLFTFCKDTTACPTGVHPYQSLLQVSNGDLFGFTGEYGDNGTLFRLSPSGSLIKTLYDFGAPLPSANMIEAWSGDLYGTTTTGGPNNAGTIFKVTTAGSLTTVYDFCQLQNCADGSTPGGGTGGSLIQATNGYFYGTTQSGGLGDGTIYQLSPSGTLKTIYKFCKVSGCPDGSNPIAVVEGLDANLYGVTTGGGAHGFGTIFRITEFGHLTVLYSMCSQTNCTDGEAPQGLLLGSDGNFYGTTHTNADSPNTIFQVTPSGAYTLLYSNDYYPALSVLTLVQATDGSFYATNDSEAKNTGYFKISIGLGPFVRALRPYGQIGQTAYILGTGLTGSTSVTFNGTAATSFTVVSDSEITVVVPTGATTGTLQVVTPGGTLSSVVEFHVFQ